MKIKLLIASLLFFIISQKVNAQNFEEKWTVGLHLGSVMYADANSKIIGGAFIDQLPRLTISRYMFSNITFQAGFSTKILDNLNYTTFDGAARYDFGLSYENVVPYILIGGSFVSAKALTTTINIGAGNTFWVLPNYGLNLQIMYKYSESRFTSQRSHIYPTVGIVYSFRPRNMNRRLWDRKH